MLRRKIIILGIFVFFSQSSHSSFNTNLIEEDLTEYKNHKLQKHLEAFEVLNIDYYKDEDPLTVVQQFKEPVIRPFLPLGKMFYKKDEDIQYKSFFSTTDKFSIFDINGHINFVIDNRLEFHHSSLAHTRKQQKTREDEYPASLKSKNFYCGELKKGFDRGHGIDFADGNNSSTKCIGNYTPQGENYNRKIRRPVVKAIREVNGQYYEEAVYPEIVSYTNDGTPIPQGFIFISKEQDNVASYYFSNVITNTQYNSYPSSQKQTKYKSIINSSKVDLSMRMTPFIYEGQSATKIQEISKKQFYDLVDSIRTSPSFSFQEEDNKALKRHLILTEFDQIATTESFDTFFKVHYAALLTGYKQKDDQRIYEDKNRFGKLMEMLVKQSLENFDELNDKFFFCNMFFERERDLYKKAVNQLTDLLALASYMDNGEEKQIIFQAVKLRVEKANENGVIILPAVKYDIEYYKNS